MKHALWILLAAALGALCSCDKLRDAGARIAGGITSSKAGSSGGTWVSEIGAEDFDSFRSQKDKLVIVDFHAPWCGPCRQLAPLLEEVATEHEGRVIVGKINVDDHREIAAREGVRGIPDLRIYRNGSMVDKMVGLPPADELRRRVSAHASSISEPGAAGEETAENEPEIRPMTADWLPPGIERR